MAHLRPVPGFPDDPASHEGLRDDSWDIEFRPGETVELECEADAVRAHHYKDVLSRFVSGVTVVTGLEGATPVGLTAQSFSSVSLEPPLVLFCPAKTSRAWPAIRRSGRFLVNVLGEEQEHLSRRFASRGTDKFDGVAWTPSPASGLPLLAGVAAYVDCTILAVHDTGDHDVVVGRVVDLQVPEGAPEHVLTFYRGTYGSTR